MTTFGLGFREHLVLSSFDQQAFGKNNIHHNLLCNTSSLRANDAYDLPAGSPKHLFLLFPRCPTSPLGKRSRFTVSENDAET